MHRRAILPLVRLAVIHVSVAVDSTPGIVSGQKAQTEQLIRPDLQVPKAQDSAPGEGED